jgi:hypothetical protein
MQVDQGPNWGCSAKEKKYITYLSTNITTIKNRKVSKSRNLYTVS